MRNKYIYKFLKNLIDKKEMKYKDLEINHIKYIFNLHLILCGKNKCSIANLAKDLNVKKSDLVKFMQNHPEYFIVDKFQNILEIN